MHLRDYQSEAHAYFKQVWASGLVRVPAVAATGLGKTFIFSHPDFLNEFLDAGQRCLFIAHTDELIEQAAKMLRKLNPGRTVGIVKAEQNEAHTQLVVSSRQTLQSVRRRNAIRNVGLIVVDEAHHALRTNTYGHILEHFGAFCEIWESTPNCHATHPKVAGFTATLARGDKGKLSSVWQMPQAPLKLYRRDILFGIRRGYLLDVVGQRVIVPDFDLSGVKQRGGDYADTALADELERTFAPEIVAAKYAEVAADRKGIAFWPLVETAYHGAKAFNDAGIRSEVIHGELPKLERRAMLQRLHSGETRVIHGVGVLTEGFDEPTVDVCVIARPTRSAPLYQQMVGRVLRPNLELPPAQRGKALILDVVGAGATHDLRSLIDLAPERPLHQTEEEQDLSLLELEELWEQEAEERAAGSGVELEDPEYRGETEVIAFDPLGRDKVWSRTPDGTYFMSAGGVGYVFLVPSLAGEPSHYDVVLCSKVSYRRDGVNPWARGTEYVDLPMDMALAEGEALADEVGGVGTKTLTAKKSPWRKKPADPDGAQAKYARRLGVWVEGMSKGECSEAIDNKVAAQRIDPLVRAVKGAGA